MKAGRAAVGHPVDVASGVVTSATVDFVIPGRIPLAWERRYSTGLLDRPPSALGRGWTSPFFSTLSRSGAVFRFVTPDGDLQLIDDSAGIIDGGGVLRQYGSFQEIRQAGSDIVVTRWDIDTGRIDCLEYAGPLTDAPAPLSRLTTVAGDALEINGGADGQLLSVRQIREGRTVTIEHDRRGRIATVWLMTAGGGRDVMARYEYNDDDCLIAAYDPLGHVERYAYDSSGRLTVETNKRGGAFTFTYDKGGRCIRTTGPDHYDEQSLRYLDAVGWTEVTNSRGEVRRLEWNGDGQIVSELSPRGARVKSEFDDHGRLTAVTDALGGRRAFQYDKDGNRDGVTHPDGSAYRFAYNEHHQLTSVVDPVGATWTFAYDEYHRLRARVEPTGHEWTYAWDAFGDLGRVESSGGGIWRYQYNALGQVEEAVLWSGRAQRFEYDERGWVRVVRDHAAIETWYDRDLLGRMVRVSRADGSGASYDYGPCGEIIRCTTSAGNVTTFEYGRACGRLLAVTHSDGRRTSYEWTSVPDRLAAIVDPDGQRHAFEYDTDGFLAADRFPNGRVIKYRRNLRGEVSERTNGAGETISYARDPLGRIVSAWSSDGSTFSFAYGATGRVIEASSPDATVRFERDVMGRRTKEVCDGVEIESAYDAIGNRLERRSSLGADEAFSYDPSGSLIEVRVSNGDVVHFGRDLFGREVRRDFPNRISLRQEFDAGHRLVEQTVVQNRLDVRSGIESRAEPLIRRRYTWDQNGGLGALWDKNWGATTFVHDLAGRVLARVDDGAPVETFTYDASGTITSSSRAFVLTNPSNGDQLPPGAERRDIAVGNQTVRAGDSTFEYDGDGRLIRKTESASTSQPRVWTYRWNALGFLTEVTAPDETKWEYSYDAFGRRVRKRGADRDVRFVWDGNAILHEVPRPGADASTWTHFPSDFVPIASVQRGASRFAITDHLGTPRELLDAHGAVAWAARLSVWGELERLDRQDTSCDIRFQGQWFDAETGLHYNNSRYYDPRIGSYISMDPVPLLGSLNGYQYVPDPLRWIDPLGLVPEYQPLDAQGRPTGAFSDLTPADRNTGTPTSSATQNPPGWVGGTHPDHQQRGHLIADSLGGSGTDPRNIVTLTDGTNNPGMARLEARIRNHLDADPNSRVLLQVTAHYDNNDPHSPPTSIHVYALDQHGNVLVDEHVQNGQRQKQKCCP